MRQFLVLIYSAGNPLTAMNQEEQQRHLAAAQAFITAMTEQGFMKSALPLEMNGIVLRGAEGVVDAAPFTPGAEPVAGYYFLEAADLETAVGLVKTDPRFGGRLTWKMEVRPVLVLPGISD